MSIGFGFRYSVGGESGFRNPSVLPPALLSRVSAPIAGWTPALPKPALHKEKCNDCAHVPESRWSIGATR